jgi:hypothetical protein
VNAWARFRGLNVVAGGWRATPHLVDVEQTDLRWIGKALGHWGCSDRWASIWERTPAPEDLADKLWHDVPWQQVMRNGRSPIGLLQLTALSPADGVATFEFIAHPAHGDAVGTLMLEFLTRAFNVFPLRKVIFFTPEDQFEVPHGILSIVRAVGTFEEHVRRGFDRYVALNMYEIWRHDAASLQS